jgi:hypothetical protein
MAKSHKTRRKSQKRRVMRGGYTPIVYPPVVYTDEQKEQLRQDDKTDEEIERFENA